MAGEVRGLIAAVHEVADAIHGYPGEHPGRRSRLRPPSALAWAMPFCRTQDEEGVWHGLAEFTKPVPAEYITKDGVVACPCGSSGHVSERLVECDGCGRWYVADASGAWCVRLPEQEAEAA